ncbi:MAG: tRNA nucleotidyltransferase [Bacteroides sp. SM23_62]|nr:MAG: tRNA nucleotidyltransferase [Bacteroides sp. SM23_62]
MKNTILSYLHMKKCLNDKIFSLIKDIAIEENMPAFVIGGYVRDCILGRDTHDIDIVVQGSGIEFARKFARSLGENIPVSIFRNFGTALVKYQEREIEFVGARKESYRRNSRKPVVEDGTLEDDQNRRDFTINAMAISLNKDNYGELIDPFNGLKDIENKILKTPLEPARTFSDDPLRMMRAIRFAAELGFSIEAKTFRGIKQSAFRISIVSKERITDELNRILLTDKPSAGLSLLDETGLMPIIFPEFHALKGVHEENGQRHKDNFFHTIQVVDNVAGVSDDLWLRWAAMLHDIAKPVTKKYDNGSGWTFHGHDFIGSKMVPRIFRTLKLPLNEKMKYVQKMVLLHLRPIALSPEGVTDSAIRRLVFDAGEDLEDLMMLCEADITSKNEKTIRRHLRNFQIVREKIDLLEEKDSIRNFQPPISGEEIMEIFGLPPSRPVGIIKNTIKEAILDGIIRNDYKEAYDLMIKKGKELGLEPVKR